MAWPLAAWRGPAQLGDDSQTADEHAVPIPPARTLIHASRIGEAVERITWLIPGLLGLNAISQLFAPGGSGKSLVALDQALCVAQVAPVVYVAAEAAGEQEERVAAWCAHHGLPVGQLYFWPRPIALKDQASVDAFLAEVRAVRPALIVIDPLASCMVGLEESSTGDMQLAVSALNTIRQATGAAINVVHHTGWTTEHERGSSVLRNACRVVIKLTSDDSGLMTLSCEKANNGRPFEARYFRLVEAGPSVTPIPASKLTTRNAALTVKHIAILEALSLAQHRDGASFTQILDYSEQGKSTLHKGINRLLERGLIARERQIYSLTDEGRHELATAAQATEFAGSPAEFTGELRVNWAVTVERSEGGLARQDAEFTEFTAQEAPVHPEAAATGATQFTLNTASECARSPQFTASSRNLGWKPRRLRRGGKPARRRRATNAQARR
jgi:DNA-binding MarR family transcriptional regulator